MRDEFSRELKTGGKRDEKKNDNFSISDICC
jgi:hypothetical protein